MFDRTTQSVRAIFASAGSALAGRARAKTGAQEANGNDISSLLNQMRGGGSTCLWTEAPPASHKVWREMIENPTIALGLAAAKAPIRAAMWNVEADDGVPEDRVQLIRDYMLPLRPTLLGDGLRAIEYGFQPFEVVWTVDNGRMVPAKLKPLLPENTSILKDKTGAFTGLKNGDVRLDVMDSLVVSFDGEAGNIAGHSRLENIRRRAWWPWEQTYINVSQYVSKSAGITPIIRYPLGSSIGPGGQVIDNGTIAKQIADRLGQNRPVIMPQQIASWAEPLLQRGTDVRELSAWKIEFLETSGGHGSELTSMLDKFEALMVRGLLQPERSLLEGSNGTKAEAGVHGDLATCIAQQDSDQLLRIVNWHLVDKVLEANFGPEAVGTVRICAAPLVDEQAELLRAILTEVLSNPANIDVLLGLVDLESAAERVGLPTRADANYPDPGETGQDESATNPTDPNATDPTAPGAVVASIMKAAAALRVAG